MLKTLDEHKGLKSVEVSDKVPVVASNYQRSINYLKAKEEYPQIFIPFYNEHKQQNLLGKEKIVIVPFYDEIEGNEYDGYVLEDGIWQKLDYKIDEDYARINEVWVISINACR